MYFKKSLNLFTTALLWICFSFIVLHVQSAPTSSGTLFNQTDKVTIINGLDQLKTTITNKPTPCMVLYYAHWCGHCINYAPTYKTFATNVQWWTNVFQVAVIDCADPANTDACRHSNITGYPTLKLYDAYYQPPSVNNQNTWTTGSRSDPELREFVITTLFSNVTDLISEKWQKSWNRRYNQGQPCHLQPNMTKFENMSDATHNAASWGTDRNVFVMTKSATLGRSIVLAIGAYIRGLSAFYVDSDTEQLEFFDETIIPLQDKLATPPTTMSFQEIITAVVDKFPNVPLRESYFTDDLDLQSEVETTTKKPTIPPSNDHAQVLSRMLNVEIYSQYNETNANAALKMIHLALSYSDTLDLSQSEIAILDDQALHLDEVPKTIVQNLNFPTFTDEWSDKCKGSVPKYRGYTCGLWRFFHTMLSHCANESSDCLDVIEIIRDYVVNFFGCKFCVAHFKSELVKFPIPEDDTVDRPLEKEHVLWLWELHNSVNKRLALGDSEDPNFPKIQFPSKTDCPECYIEDGWDRDEVFKFLQGEYGGFTVEDDMRAALAAPLDDDPELDEDQNVDEDDVNLDDANMEDADLDETHLDDGNLDDTHIDDTNFGDANPDMEDSQAHEPEVDEPTPKVHEIILSEGNKEDESIHDDADGDLKDGDGENDGEVEDENEEEEADMEGDHPPGDDIAEMGNEDDDVELDEGGEDVVNPDDVQEDVVVEEKEVPAWIQEGVERFEANHNHDEEDEKITTTLPPNPNDAEQQANWDNLEAKRIAMLRRGDRQHQAHEHLSDYTEQLENLGFNEDEIHEKLRNGDLSSVKQEIAHQTKQIEQFLVAFKRIAEEYDDDPEGFKQARARLFHKVEDGSIVYSLDELERLRHRDPQKLRSMASQWHYKAGNVPRGDIPIDMDSSFNFQVDYSMDHHVYTMFLITMGIFVTFACSKMCKRRRYSKFGLAGGYTILEKDPEKQF